MVQSHEAKGTNYLLPLKTQFGFLVDGKRLPSLQDILIDSSSFFRFLTIQQIQTIFLKSDIHTCMKKPIRRINNLNLIHTIHYLERVLKSC